MLTAFVHYRSNHGALMVGRSVTLAEIEAVSALSLHYYNARAELAAIAKIIAEKTADPAERQRLWSGMLELLATP
jgi:hypothetical protein